MNQPQVVYTTKEIADMLGVGRSLILKKIAAGHLKSFRKPHFYAGNTAHFVNRSELVRWLLSADIHPKHIRRMLNQHERANVVLVRTRASLQTALMREDRAIRVDSLFALGDILHKWKVWAIAVDLGEIGATEATRSLSAFAKQTDRPELVGLYDTDYFPRPATAEVFDILLPLSRDDASLAASIAELKPQNLVLKQNRPKVTFSPFTKSLAGGFA